jgi:hypothetical protein
MMPMSTLNNEECIALMPKTYFSQIAFFMAIGS